MTHDEALKIIHDYCDPIDQDYCHDGCVISDMCLAEGCVFELDKESSIKAAQTILESQSETPEEEPTEDMVNHPPHYTQGGMECIDEMVLIFGKQAVANFCVCNAWKYRKRAMFKNGQEDIDKSDWYINKFKELRDEE